jgi:hypothetical protein
LIEKETDYHDRTSPQPANANALNAQKNLPLRGRQQFYKAVTDPTKEHPAEVSMPQCACDLCSSLPIMEYIPNASRSYD